MTEAVTHRMRSGCQKIHDAAVALGAGCAGQPHPPIGKASADDPDHPGWLAGTPNGLGGKFAPKDRANFLELDQIPADAKEHPVVLRDSAGKPILDDNGNQILRPAHLDPEFFVREGEAFKHQFPSIEQTWPEATIGISTVLGSQLLQFGHNGPWDAQRIDGKNIREYRDYASIAIGLYMAAAGFSLDDSLAIQNEYIRFKSTFKNEPKDEIYTKVPKRNVRNTQIGCELYESGRVHP